MTSINGSSHLEQAKLLRQKEVRQDLQSEDVRKKDVSSEARSKDDVRETERSEEVAKSDSKKEEIQAIRKDDDRIDRNIQAQNEKRGNYVDITV